MPRRCPLGCHFHFPKREKKLMLPNKSLIVMLSFVLAVPILIAPDSASGAGMEPTYHATVKGGPNGLQRLKMFHEQLKQLLGVTDLALAEVGCDKCADLDSGPPEQSLSFYMPQNAVVVLAFALSWRHVQANSGHDLFKLEFDRVQPPDPVCPNITGCKPRAACEATDFCDKPWGGVCNKCS
jgi:hypothetical protein